MQISHLDRLLASQDRRQGRLRDPPLVFPRGHPPRRADRSQVCQSDLDLVYLRDLAHGIHDLLPGKHLAYFP